MGHQVPVPSVRLPGSKLLCLLFSSRAQKNGFWCDTTKLDFYVEEQQAGNKSEDPERQCASTSPELGTNLEQHPEHPEHGRHNCTACMQDWRDHRLMSSLHAHALGGIDLLAA